jgi:hypothetical protein
VKRVNTFQVYQLGGVLKDLQAIPQDPKLGDVLFRFATARSWIAWLLDNQMLPLTYCRPAAQDLVDLLSAALSPAFTPDGQPGTLEQAVPQQLLWQIPNALQTFEHNLAAELQQHDTYLVLQKGIYSTNQLVEHAETSFRRASVRRCLRRQYAI